MKRIGYIDARRIKGFNFTKLSGGGPGINSEVKYDPPIEGYGTPVGVAGTAILATGKKFKGGQGFMWGVQGHLMFEDEAEVEQANAIFAGLRGVITAAGVPVFTIFDTIACIYCDNQCPRPLAGIAVDGEGSALASLQNHGDTLDHGIVIRGNQKITNVFDFVTLDGAITFGEAGGVPVRQIRCLVDGETCYLNAYPTLG